MVGQIGALASNQSTVALKPRAKRAFRPKVRTGCQTCKGRHVKCDEEKPTCRRCTNTGRCCDGYTLPGTLYFEILDPSEQKNRQPSFDQAVPFAMSSTLFESSDEARHFQFFREVTTPALAAFTAPYIWNTVVPQICHEEPAVRHLIYATAISHQATHDLVFQGPDSDPRWLDDPRRASFMDHYTKAMGRLARQSTNSVSLEGILLCCLLFVSVENFQNKNERACKHIRSGVNIVNEWKARNGPVMGLDGPVTRSSDELIGRYLVPMFESLGTKVDHFKQAQAAQPDPKLDLTMGNTKPIIPYRYSHLHEACRGIDKILFYLFKQHKTLLLFHEQRAAVLKVAGIHEILAQWDTAVRRSRESILPHDMPRLDVHRQTLAILLETYALPAETVYDAYFSTFEKMVSDCEKNIERNHASSELDKNHLSFELGTIPPLFMTAISCRDPALRRKAVTLLHSAGRAEGLWDSCLAANVAQCIIEEEERGYGPLASAGTILSFSRVRPLSAQVYPRSGRVVVKYMRQPFVQTNKNPEEAVIKTNARSDAAEDMVVVPSPRARL